MKLKIFTFVTGLLIALCAQAQTSGQTGPLTWSYDAGTRALSITGRGDMPDYSNASPQPWKAYCSEIQNVTIGEGVIRIGNDAFSGCRALQNITIPSSVTAIGDNAFGGCEVLQSITIPVGVTTIGYGVFNCPALTTINVDPANAHYEVENSVLYTKGKAELIRYPQGKAGTAFTVPDEVTTIQSYAFFNCEALQNIILPTGLTTIRSWAFGVCQALQKITIPASVTEIERFAFIGCNIKELTVKWNTPLTINLISSPIPRFTPLP